MIEKKSEKKEQDRPTCIFCQSKSIKIVQQTELSIALRDTYPISQGHTLIIPKRHVQSFFDLSLEEQTDLLHLATLCKSTLDAELQPSGYNLGINNGKSAGQTIMHVHLHLIPRYTGDAIDPRGGIRWIFPNKANYWEKEK